MLEQGNSFVRGCCEQQGLVGVQEATREIHSHDMHGKLRVTIVLVLESQTAATELKLCTTIC